MSNSALDENSAQESDFLDEDSEWVEGASDTGIRQDSDETFPRGGPRWKAIEDYWERKRLRDALQDYTTDDE